IRAVLRRASLKPAEQARVKMAVRCEPFATGVRDRAQGLFNHQAFFRYGEIDPAADAFASEPLIITFRIVAKERQAKTVFAPRRAMACSGITTGFHEDRHDIQ